jgi:uncharacterized membrane protein YidH (DUF202 family)
MATRWQERIRATEQARFESSPVGRLLTALGISIWLRRVRFARRAFVTRKLKFVAGSVAAVGLIVVVVAVPALVVVFGQLA